MGRLTPDEARREARRLLSDVERGFDPCRAAALERHAITVAICADEYLAKAEAGLIIGRKACLKRPARSKSIGAGSLAISFPCLEKNRSST